MVTHISARLAWHADGWNGHVCRNPRANVYCVGQHSYPGEQISEERDLDWEMNAAGLQCSDLDIVPPCTYSINAFGKGTIRAYAKPPQFFKDKTQVKYWDVEPSTVNIWPYEEMYKDEVKFTPEESSQTYNYTKRLTEAENYFSELEPGNSLIFYYSNYSNPFSEEDSMRYVIVGVSRFKKLGNIMYYDGISEENKRKYAGGFIWQMPVTSNYPEEGFRIPYHLYMDQPEILAKILFVPDNDRNFKYATRRFSDDEALALIEKFLEIVDTLIEIGDTSENWVVRKTWLESLISELWVNRGAYPGLLKVMKVMGFTQIIPLLKETIQRGKEKEIKEAIFDFLNGKITRIEGLELSEPDIKRLRRSWLLKDKAEQMLLSGILPLFDLTDDQIAKILSQDRQAHGIYSSLKELTENPYIISEQFIGDDSDDRITFNKIDHGLMPSPELGLPNFVDKDDCRRFRALIVECLKRQGSHTFLPVSLILREINKKLKSLPEWKKHQFTENYFKVDEAELSKALVLRDNDGRKYAYLKNIFEDERLVGDVLRSLANRKNISLTAPVTDASWHTYLYDSSSILAVKNPKEYDKAISGQIEVCKKILNKPLCVISGEAGTGKTTIIKALIYAIEKISGNRVPIKLLAPTGKAADRMREKTGRDASTIHSLLASNNWLNDNLTVKRVGGKSEEGSRIIIIDESSMLDLELIAALFRSINWKTVQRLIFVGDPNQLPPIGRGRAFADIIDWLSRDSPESVAILENNIRQIENRLSDHGTGITELASLFVHRSITGEDDSDRKARIENMLQKMQYEGDIDHDLRVLYWNNPEDLTDKLVGTMISDLEAEYSKFDSRSSGLERSAIAENARAVNIEHDIVISPYRGEQFGIDNLNVVMQKVFNSENLERYGAIAGITLSDKVIQVRNRGKSDPLYCYDCETRRPGKIDVYNGEIGYVKPHGSDFRQTGSKSTRVEQFQVVFARKPNKHVEYRKTGRGKVEDNLELAYAISVHKAQGSEFDHVYFILPKNKKQLLSTELVYTGITRAKKHLTLLVEEDSSPILALSQPASSKLRHINSSIFYFNPLPDELLLPGWFEDKKIFKTLTKYVVRSMSEVVIANMLADRDIPFAYEKPLFASDGSMYLPDFTITWEGEDWYWEHLGMLRDAGYAEDWAKKELWYNQNFPGKLITTRGSTDLSEEARKIIEQYFTY